MKKETVPEGMMLARIPFDGFYHSLHDSNLDHALNQLLSDDSGNTNDRLVELAFDTINWSAAHTAYAEGYAENFGAVFDIKSLKFESMESPRDYFQGPDRVFVHISIKDVRAIYKRVGMPSLRLRVKEECTSRSGFCSFYTNDVDEWPAIPQWDHNHIFVLLQALVGDDFDSWKENDLMERDQCNGQFENWLFEGASPELSRLCNINDYLRRREERNWPWSKQA